MGYVVFEHQHHAKTSLCIPVANTALFNSKEKIHINVVVIGHVDSGKSTTTGNPPELYHSTNATHTLQAISSTSAVVSTSVLSKNLRRYATHTLCRGRWGLSSHLGGAQISPAPRYAKFSSSLNRPPQLMLTPPIGSRRAGQGFLQVRMGARQTQGGA